MLILCIRPILHKRETLSLHRLRHDPRMRVTIFELCIQECEPFLHGRFIVLAKNDSTQSVQR